MCNLCVGELSEPLPIPVLEEVDVKVDGAVEGGQEVADAGHIWQPGWPVHLSLVKKYKSFNPISYGLSDSVAPTGGGLRGPP